MALILNIDTSTSICSVALADSGEITTIKESNKMPNLLPIEPLIKGATLLILLVFNILKIGIYLIHTDYHKEERIHTHKIRQ